MRTAIMVAAIFGGLAGVAEAARVAIVDRRPDLFVPLAGYAILVDAAIFALLGGLAAATWRLVCRLRRAPLDPSRLVPVWLPAGFLAIAGVLLLGGLRVSGACPGCGGGHARAAMLLATGLRSGAGPIFAPAQALAPPALLATSAALGRLSLRVLGWLRCSPLAGRPVLPLTLALCLGGAALIVAQDLGALGLDLRGLVQVAAAGAQAFATRAAPAVSWLDSFFPWTPS